MRRIFAILATILTVTALSGCTKEDGDSSNTTTAVAHYDKGDVYSTINAFCIDVRDGNFDSAKQYYKGAQDISAVEFSSLVKSSYFGRAIDSDQASYAIHSYNAQDNLIRIQFVYNNESHFFAVEPSENGYKIIFNEEDDKDTEGTNSSNSTIGSDSDIENSTTSSSTVNSADVENSSNSTVADSSIVDTSDSSSTTNTDGTSTTESSNDSTTTETSTVNSDTSSQ